jgi:hypothetical protein
LEREVNLQESKFQNYKEITIAAEINLTKAVIIVIIGITETTDTEVTIKEMEDMIITDQTDTDYRKTTKNKQKTNDFLSELFLVYVCV